MTPIPRVAATLVATLVAISAPARACEPAPEAAWAFETRG